jgi:hypothetical protein
MALPPRCEDCGASLAAAPPNHVTLAIENGDLRARVERLEQEILEITGGGYISSDSAAHFHRAGCKWSNEIPSAKRLIYYSHAEAVEDGKRPRKTSCS